MQKIHHKKSLGQHFIKDPNLHRKIVGKAEEIENFNIIEIGPGDGGLSKAILEKKPKKLLMIEKDDDLIPYLQNIFHENENAEIISGDGTLIDLKKIVEQPIKIIANLPYNVATQMILNWLSYINFFTSITVLIQKEVAERFLAKVGENHYGRTAVLTNLVANVRKEFDVPPGAFTPPPKVNSTLITFTPIIQQNHNVNFNDFAKFTKIAFAQPRKTIYNNLRHNFQNINEILEEINIENNRRAETISLDEFIALYKILYQ